MQNQQNNKRRYLIVAAIVLVILAIVWLIMSNAKRTKDTETSEQETGYSISASRVFKYQNNILEWDSDSIELGSDIINALPLDDKILIHTVANEKYPQGQYAVYQDKTEIFNLPENTNSAKWIGDKVFYVVTEDDKSVVYSQSNQKITSIPHKYASIIPAGNNFILSYATDTDQAGHIYYNNENNTQSQIPVPEDFVVVCSSDNLDYLLLAPINGPNEPYRLYLTRKKEMLPVGSNLESDSIKWVESKGFVSIRRDPYSSDNDKLILISTAGKERVLYESEESLKDILVVGNKVLMITNDGKQLQADI